MLWDVIRDFFVHYIFGGIDSHFDEYVLMAGDYEFTSIQIPFYYATNDSGEISGFYQTLPDALCTLCTIVSLFVILVLACLLIKKIYNICAHVIG